MSSQEPSHKGITQLLDQISGTHTNSEEEIRVSFPNGHQSVLFIFDHNYIIHTKVHVYLAVSSVFEML